MNVATAAVIAVGRYFAEDARRTADRYSELANRSAEAAARRQVPTRVYIVLEEMLAGFPEGVDVDLLCELRVQAFDMVAEWQAEDALLAA